MSQTQAEQKIRAQLRKAMNAHIDAPASRQAQTWARVQRLDAQLRALQGK